MSQSPTVLTVEDDAAIRRCIVDALRFAGYSVFGADVALTEALEREGGSWAGDELHELGTRAGSIDAQAEGSRTERRRSRSAGRTKCPMSS
jgi:hypothetical protein